ncbi:MAG: hypothetical protein P9C36_05210 [Defluviicoccus sp.]|nr:hypothetical protein [Defluviicoccus sp.]MDG4592009.1 hypothetical protein [Defluviicoccus sp.]MDS4074125.1 hypothetical protein [Defluviicoccus sp.]
MIPNADMQNLIANPWVWTIALGGLLFYPTRQLLWVMSVRRLERQLGKPSSEEERGALKRRTAVTAALLCFVFSVAYVNVVMAPLFAQP